MILVRKRKEEGKFDLESRGYCGCILDRYD